MDLLSVPVRADSRPVRPGAVSWWWGARWRGEYVRRRLAQDAAAQEAAVTTADLARFGEVFADLADSEVMDQAWR